MLVKQIGNVNVHFGPLIVVIVIALVAMFIRAIFLGHKGKRVIELFKSGEYSRVIVDASQLLKVYQSYAKRAKLKNTSQWIEFLNFALAVSYFSEGNHDHFLKHIRALEQDNNVKAFWLSLFYLQQADFDNAKIYYDEIEIGEKTHVNIAFLDSYLHYKNGDFATSQEKMTAIYKSLNHPILKQIADEVLA